MTEELPDMTAQMDAADAPQQKQETSAEQSQWVEQPEELRRPSAEERDSVIRLVGAVLAEQHEWTEGRRYLGLDALTRARATADQPTSTTQTDQIELEPAA